MKTKLQPIDYKQDPTPYQQWKREGKSTKSFFTMTLTLLCAIPAFVYVASALGDPFMKGHITGPIVTGVIIYAFWKLLELCDEKF